MSLLRRIAFAILPSNGPRRRYVLVDPVDLELVLRALEELPPPGMLSRDEEDALAELNRVLERHAP